MGAPLRVVAVILGAVLLGATALAFAASLTLGIVFLGALLFLGLNVAWAWGLIEGLRDGKYRREQRPPDAPPPRRWIDEP